MFINAIVLSVALQIYFMYTILTAEEVWFHDMYSKIINKQPQVLTGQTEFCQTGDRNLWVKACKQVLKELRVLNKFKEVYVDYRFYPLEEVNSKCQEKLVILPQLHVRLYREVIEYIQRTRKPKIKQHLAICHTRPVVVSNNQPSKTKADILEMLAITVTGTPWNMKILVFHKKQKSSKYLPYKAYKTNLYYQNNVNPELFTQHPPTSTRTGFKNIFEDSKEVLIAPETCNIVHRSDRFSFARLCMMAIRLSQYPESSVRVRDLCLQKPAAVTKNVYIKQPTIVYPEGHKFQTDVYPCMNSHEYATNTSWTFLQNMYALMKGPKDNSLIVLAHKESSVDRSVILIPIELIDNVSKEFLYEIYVPDLYEEDCTPPTSEEQESCGSNQI